MKQQATTPWGPLPLSDGGLPTCYRGESTLDVVVLLLPNNVAPKMFLAACWIFIVLIARYNILLNKREREMSSLPAPPPPTNYINPNSRQNILSPYSETVGHIQHLLDLADFEWRQCNGRAEAKTLRDAHNKVANLRQRLREAKWALRRVQDHKEMG